MTAPKMVFIFVGYLIASALVDMAFDFTLGFWKRTALISAMIIVVAMGIYINENF